MSSLEILDGRDYTLTHKGGEYILILWVPKLERYVITAWRAHSYGELVKELTEYLERVK